MKTSASLFTLAVAVWARGTAAATATTAMGVEQPSSAPIYQQPVVQGCFSSSGDLVKNSTQPYNSRGKCGGDICQALNKTVAATTRGSECYCGDSYPSNSTLVADKFCNSPCLGYGVEACGGNGYWTVYNTGLVLYDIPYADDDSKSSSTTSTSAPTAVTTKAGSETVFVTATNSPEGTTQATTGAGTKKHSSTAGIAAGVVVGVVVAAAVVGGGIFYLRRRRAKEIEDEHRRTAAVNAFFNGKPPGSSGGLSGLDARLDPDMAQRRISSGSIADNQDYSRKILRVTNA